MTDDNQLEQYLKDFEDDYCLQDRQRELASEDMRFSVVPGGQWEGFLEDVYEERTKLELDMVDVAVERFMGDFADNRIDIKYSPDGEETSDEDADLLQGLYRKDARRGRAKQSMMAAVGEAVRCGFGCIKVATVYEDEEDAEDEKQRGVFDYIPNAYNCVAFDSNSKQEDKSDAMHVTVLYEYEKKAFEKEWPEGDKVSVNSDNNGRRFNWADKDSVFVGHRYEIKERKVKMHTFINGQTEEVQIIEDDDLDLVESDLLAKGWDKTREKVVKKREVFKTVFSGAAILEPEKKISGKLLPIIPIYAYRYYVDGQEFYYGLVRKLKDAQRLFNMEVTQAAEVSSTGNRDIPIIDPKSFQGYEAHWLTGNIYDKQFLPASSYIDDRGNVMPANQGSIPAAQMSPTSAALLEVVGNYIKETTGGQQADITDVDMSGKAIRELVKRANLNTRSVWENIKSSIVRMGEVYKSIADDIYAMPRQAKILNEDGSEKTVRLMQPTLDQSGKLTEINNIKKMKFEVYASVGVAYESERNETVETLRSLITEAGEGNQEYIAPMFASLIDNLSGTNLDVLKDFNRKKMLAMGLVEPQSQEEAEYIQSLNQPNSQDELVKAAAQQQMAEAENLRAQAVERISKTELNRAKAVETIENIKIAKINALREAISTAA